MGITTSVVARILGVSAQTVIDYARTGRLHPIRATSGWRYYDPKEIERFAKERKKRWADAERSR